jgi:thiosulfate reductase cytochrome b subunit
MGRLVQAITILGLAVCLGVLYARAKKARKQPANTRKKHFDTAHLLVGALLVWLVISMNLRHLDRSLSGEPQAPQSTWERVIRTLSDWGI